MIKPQNIINGNTIGVVSTARKISLKEINPAIEILESWGLKVVVGNTIGMEDNQYAGTDEQRLEDLQWMLDDPDIHAIVCARGGYGTVRIIDKINFDSFVKKPKWICGFSDVTVLHSHINKNFHIETIHSAMLVNFPKDKTENIATETLRKALFGEPLAYTVPNHALNRKGVANGEIIGGNLSLIYGLTGSVSDIDTYGKILFIEDLDEYLYHIDRMMMNLKRSGKLSNIKGLIVGGMTEMKDNAIPFGKNAEEIILDAVKEYAYPVCFDFPAGHLHANSALIMGREVCFEVDDKVHLRFNSR